MTCWANTYLSTFLRRRQNIRTGAENIHTPWKPCSLTSWPGSRSKPFDQNVRETESPLAQERKPSIPRATYRLQFTKDFGFKEAASVAPYLAELGVSHVYASPYLKARPGSSHGYDIISHVELNPELGSDADFSAMVDTFKANGLGQILDFVPNHMGVGGADNRWWLDVLEWGSQSEYAAWFDIDWRSGHEYLHDKLLVPFLGDHFGVVLENGEVELKFDAEEGGFAVWAYGSHKLPVCPRDYGLIIGNGAGELERLGDAFSDLNDQHPQTMNRAKRLKDELSACSRDPRLLSDVGKALKTFNGRKGELETWSRLNALMAKQSWRLAHFRVAAEDMHYRRFFNVNDLAGLRMEIPELFDHAHSLVFKLLEDGTIDGLRLDHIDDLLDPKAYCLRIREKAPVPFYLLVEKILAPHEHLRESWEVDGTTGYEFANLLTSLLIHPSGEKHLTDYYRTFTKSDTPFETMVRDCKLQIMENEMASELGVLAREAGRVARSNPRTLISPIMSSSARYAKSLHPFRFTALTSIPMGRRRKIVAIWIGRSQVLSATTVISKRAPLTSFTNF